MPAINQAAVASVQAFGLRSPGGGPRILRALFEDHEDEVLSVCTDPRLPPAAGKFLEAHLPLRPRLGRLEATRANRLMPAIDLAYGGRFARELRLLCEAVSARTIHGVAHSLDFVYAHKVAEEMGLPFLLSVHDDLRSIFHGRVFRSHALQGLERAWRRADRCYVISEALGEEYVRRYGKREYAVVTDGLTQVHPARTRAAGSVSVYFAGLMHLSYRRNLEAMLQGVALYRRRHGHADVTLRCGGLDKDWRVTDIPVTVLPFADESAVEADLEQASLLYLPLPFDATYDDFVRFSLSTKLVTYLGSGLPILYHGPAHSAAARLLMQHDAAVIVSTLDPHDICDGILKACNNSGRIVASARRLATAQFRIAEQQRVFWDSMPARRHRESSLGVAAPR